MDNIDTVKFFNNFQYTMNSITQQQINGGSRLFSKYSMQEIKTLDISREIYIYLNLLQNHQQYWNNELTEEISSIL